MPQAAQCGRDKGRRFTSRYNVADIALLVAVDGAHDTLNGPATQKILYRQFFEFADVRYERLATISVAHIYNLRKQRRYRDKRMVFTKTKPTPVSIGERRLERRAGAQSDTGAASKMQQAKAKLFSGFAQRRSA